MLLSEAIRKRIKHFLDKKEMTLWQLYKSSGVPKATIYAFMNSDQANLLKLDTLLHLCEGFGISIKEFFNDPIFEDVEQD